MQYIKRRNQAVSAEHHTHSPIRLGIHFHTLSSWAHGLTNHNPTLVPTWLPSDGNCIAGLAASPADELQTRLHRPALPDYDVRTNLTTRRPHAGRLTCPSSRRARYPYRLTLNTESINNILTIRLQHSAQLRIHR